jgi:hypothetical protein
VGIHLQRGWRAPEKDKIFKLQVWFADYYNKAEDKHSGTFKGRVKIEGLEIGPETTFDSIRGELEKRGFAITHYPYVIIAAKGEISILTADTTNKIERVQVFITPNQSLQPAASRRTIPLYMSSTRQPASPLAPARRS